MTKLEEQILEIIDNVEYVKRHIYLLPKDRQKIMAREIESLFETELNKFAYEQGLYSYDKEKIKKAVDRYLSNKQKPNN